MNIVLPSLKSYTEIRCPFILSKRIWKLGKTKTFFRCNRTLSSLKNIKRPLLIGTHDGRFHCDEVFACWMLKQLPQYKDAKILRTRDHGQLDLCDVVVDVGGLYDPARNRYDHHQSTFNETMYSLAGMKSKTRLSSCGLIYFHKGKELISHLSQLPYHHSNVELLFQKLYKGLIEEIDAVDNSIDQFDGVPRYLVSTALASRVGRLNPAWNKINPDYETGFRKAMEICGEEFMLKLDYFKNGWLPARELVEEGINNRYSVDPSGKIIVLSKTGCPWRQHLIDIEKEMDIFGTVKIILNKTSGYWRIQCVDINGNFRIRFPNEWHGQVRQELSTLSGIDGCMFVDKIGLTAGHKSYTGALEMAGVALTCEK